MERRCVARQALTQDAVISWHRINRGTGAAWRTFAPCCHNTLSVRLRHIRQHVGSAPV